MSNYEELIGFRNRLKESNDVYEEDAFLLDRVLDDIEMYEKALELAVGELKNSSIDWTKHSIGTKEFCIDYFKIKAKESLK